MRGAEPAACVGIDFIIYNLSEDVPRELRWHCDFLEEILNVQGCGRR